ncbi:hypothetical protein V4U86_12690 [Mycobacterium sp. AMU20-3851]|uniref:hypothetical protein n=1 Tax=Mycobacterium sp. AMU20-3851 TaxID=3122055 RepID=UPI0037544EC3
MQQESGMGQGIEVPRSVLPLHIVSGGTQLESDWQEKCLATSLFFFDDPTGATCPERYLQSSRIESITRVIAN